MGTARPLGCQVLSGPDRLALLQVYLQVSDMAVAVILSRLTLSQALRLLHFEPQQRRQLTYAVLRCRKTRLWTHGTVLSHDRHVTPKKLAEIDE